MNVVPKLANNKNVQIFFLIKNEQLIVSQANLFAALKKYLFNYPGSLQLVEKYKNEVNKLKTDIQFLGEQ